MFRYFTIKSANEALPSVIEKFNNLKTKKQKMGSIIIELKDSLNI